MKINMLLCHIADIFLLDYMVRNLSAHTKGRTEGQWHIRVTWTEDSEETLSSPIPGHRKRVSATQSRVTPVCVCTCVCIVCVWVRDLHQQLEWGCCSGGSCVCLPALHACAYWEYVLSLAASWTWRHGSTAASPLSGYWICPPRCPLGFLFNFLWNRHGCSLFTSHKVYWWHHLFCHLIKQFLYFNHRTMSNYGSHWWQSFFRSCDAKFIFFILLHWHSVILTYLSIWGKKNWKHAV